MDNLWKIQMDDFYAHFEYHWTPSSFEVCSIFPATYLPTPQREVEWGSRDQVPQKAAPVLLGAGEQQGDIMFKGSRRKTSSHYTRVSLTLLAIRASLGGLLKMFSGPHAQKFSFSRSQVGTGNWHRYNTSKEILTHRCNGPYF